MMKYKLITLLLLSNISLAAFAQSGKTEINYSEPIQVDSSDYFMIPKVIDNDDREEFGKGAYWGGGYSEIYFYNAKTRQTKKLFNGQLALISPMTLRRRSYYDMEKEPEYLLPDHIIYVARTENFNGDKSINYEDPGYLYISTRTGDNLRQITPQGFTVHSWTVSKDKKSLLVKGKHDNNGNKKFGKGDDDAYYHVVLDPDVSKIQCHPVPM